MEDSLTEFIEFCKDKLKDKIVKLLKKRITECSIKFSMSPEFKDLIQVTQAKISTDERNRYVHIRDFLEEIKKQNGEESETQSDGSKNETLSNSGTKEEKSPVGLKIKTGSYHEQFQNFAAACSSRSSSDENEDECMTSGVSSQESVSNTNSEEVEFLIEYNHQTSNSENAEVDKVQSVQSSYHVKTLNSSSTVFEISCSEPDMSVTVKSPISVRSSYSQSRDDNLESDLDSCDIIDLDSLSTTSSVEICDSESTIVATKSGKEKCNAKLEKTRESSLDQPMCSPDSQGMELVGSEAVQIEMIGDPCEKTFVMSPEIQEEGSYSQGFGDSSVKIKEKGDVIPDDADSTTVDAEKDDSVKPKVFSNLGSVVNKLKNIGPKFIYGKTKSQKIDSCVDIIDNKEKPYSDKKETNLMASSELTIDQDIDQEFSFNNENMKVVAQKNTKNVEENVQRHNKISTSDLDLSKQQLSKYEIAKTFSSSSAKEIVNSENAASQLTNIDDTSQEKTDTANLAAENTTVLENEIATAELAEDNVVIETTKEDATQQGREIKNAKDMTTEDLTTDFVVSKNTATVYTTTSKTVTEKMADEDATKNTNIEKVNVDLEDNTTEDTAIDAGSEDICSEDTYSDNVTTGDTEEMTSTKDTTTEDSALEDITKDEDIIHENTTLDKDTTNEDTTKDEDITNENTTLDKDTTNEDTTKDEDITNENTTLDKDTTNEDSTKDDDTSNEDMFTSERAADEAAKEESMCSDEEPQNLVDRNKCSGKNVEETVLNQKKEKVNDVARQASDASPGTPDTELSTSDAVPATSDTTHSTSDSVPSQSDSVSGVSDQRKQIKPQQRGSKSQIQRLEKLLEDIKDKIEELKQREVNLDEMDDDESAYILEDRYQRKFVKVWNKLCELKGRSSSTGRPTEQKFRYSGSRFPEVNRKIESFINKTKTFPDFHDVKQVIGKVNLRENLGLRSTMVDKLAREVFTDVGDQLQKRRQKDLLVTFRGHLSNIVDLSVDRTDPAKDDPELLKKLEHSGEEGRQRLKDVLEKYVHKQYDKESKEEESEEDEKGSQEGSDSTASDDEPVAEMDQIMKEEVPEEFSSDVASVYDVSKESPSDVPSEMPTEEISCQKDRFLQNSNIDKISCDSEVTSRIDNNQVLNSCEKDTGLIPLSSNETRKLDNEIVKRKRKYSDTDIEIVSCDIKSNPKKRCGTDLTSQGHKNLNLKHYEVPVSKSPIQKQSTVHKVQLHHPPSQKGYDGPTKNDEEKYQVYCSSSKAGLLVVDFTQQSQGKSESFAQSTTNNLSAFSKKPREGQRSVKNNFQHHSHYTKSNQMNSQQTKTSHLKLKRNLDVTYKENGNKSFKPSSYKQISTLKEKKKTSERDNNVTLSVLDDDVIVID